MKRRTINIISILLLLCSGLLAQDVIDRTGELTVPWEEFKQLLNLDKNEITISLETFQKLLIQTGIKTAPKHTVINGNVVLSRDAFQNLVNQMKQPSGDGIVSPFNYIITKVIYSGKMGNAYTHFTGTFNVHVLKKDAYIKIPILPTNIAISEVKVNNGKALVISENGYHNVLLSKEGEYEVKVTFSVKSAPDKGPNKIDLAIQKIPITLLNLELPLKDIDVEIPQAQLIQTDIRGNSTKISAVISPGQAISVRWRKKVELAERIQPKLYSEINHLIAIEDDLIKVTSDIFYNILHSQVDAVQIVIPEELNILTVSGEGVGEWQESQKEGKKLLNIPFTYSQKGNVKITITTETSSTEAGLAIPFSSIRTVDTVRETGFIGIELNTSAEVILAESEGLEKVAIQKLPQSLINKSVKPLIMGFKYLKHPFNMVLDVKKHEKIGVPVATINMANIVTLFTEDGKVVHRIAYQIRNSAKQLLAVNLPDNADVWSVFVNKNPVESSINSEGQLLIPLIRSTSENNKLDTFPVEIIYALTEDEFTIFGSKASQLPSVDLLTSQLIWSVYLPNDYSFIHFKSSLEKEEIIRGWNILTGGQREYSRRSMSEIDKLNEFGSDNIIDYYKEKNYSSKFRNVPLESEEMSQQVDAEIQFGGRLEGLAGDAYTPPSGISGAGLLPIQIEVPISGQIYRFARTIINPTDPLEFSVLYTRMWTILLLKWLILIFVIWIIYHNRKKLLVFWKRITKKLNPFLYKFKKQEIDIKKYTESPALPLILILLVFVFAFMSRPLSVFFSLLFLISGGYYIFQRFEKKEPKRGKPKKS
ncbi:hypothetical protein ACFL4B_00020 [Candidatus Neomarinimicrobiota bacterium]